MIDKIWQIEFQEWKKKLFFFFFTKLPFFKYFPPIISGYMLGIKCRHMNKLYNAKRIACLGELELKWKKKIRNSCLCVIFAKISKRQKSLTNFINA